ncbi:hypothetical protein EIN_054460 [Entamoeba invadens IP1]|uniref:hypothetical protein n=1 Tax=Entamoeba invadens IP1 TaxID=370355 RepID=UPI0002C3F6E7|nr:hypothetical protein EIN_054460 [Entamoeba invadens IP1]ELP93161.1 hypothetical protein EIN_054460 [Entamoeba invadens IP1]|eukprot:XP_004259932.1 hypothetical protein EIN_054460 [Entamoeba invadens IP1]
MNVDYQIERGGFAGKKMQGTVTLNCTSSFLVKTIFLKITKIVSTQNRNKDVIEYSIFPLRVYFYSHEFCPGISQVFFECEIPLTFPLMFVSDKVGLKYYGECVVTTSNTTEFKSRPKIFPVLFDQRKLLKQSKAVNKEMNGYIVSMHSSQIVYHKDKTVRLYFNACRLKADQADETFYFKLMQQTKVGNTNPMTEILSTTQFKTPIKSVENVPLVFTPTEKCCPSVEDSFVSLYHFVVLSLQEDSFESTEDNLWFPIYVSGWKPKSVSYDLRRYIKQIDLQIDPSIFSDERIKREVPHIPDGMYSKDGTEVVMLSDNTHIKLDHFNRRVLGMDNIPIDMVYPSFDSFLLNNGLTFGLYKNREIVVDHVAGCAKFTDQVDEVPQAVKVGSTTAVLTLVIEQTEGIQCQDMSSIGDVTCAVYVDEFSDLKNKRNIQESYSIDEQTMSFKNTKFVIDVSQRLNVIVSFIRTTREKREIIGFVDLKLSHIPFPSLVEKWFDFMPSPLGEEFYIGRVKMKIGYDTKAHTQLDHFVVLPDYFSMFCVPEYVLTEATISLIEIQKLFCDKRKLHNQCVVVNGDVRLIRQLKFLHVI